MRVFFKLSDRFVGSCWAEVWGQDDWTIAGDARILVTSDTVFIDDIEVKPQYRGKGIGRAIVARLEQTGLKVQPVGVLKSAEGFWDKVTPNWRD